MFTTIRNALAAGALGIAVVFAAGADTAKAETHPRAQPADQGQIELVRHRYRDRGHYRYRPYYRDYYYSRPYYYGYGSRPYRYDYYRPYRPYYYGSPYRGFDFGYYGRRGGIHFRF
jgi:hypothetical protein